MTMKTRIMSYIGGSLRSAPEAHTFENLNPATGEVLFLVSRRMKAQNEAVANARAAFPAWRP